MTLVVLAYLGGVLTLLSPCILPILPFVFARAGQPFARSVLPLLGGLAATFTLFALLASVGGGWVVHASEAGRDVALALLAALGILLIAPRLADRALRPFVGWGDRLSRSVGPGGAAGRTAAGSFVIGIATGLIWAPCAGPILGLILTGAALKGPSAHTAMLLGSYAAGAATSLGIVLFAGGRVYRALKRSLGAGEWVRRGLGVAVLAAVAVIALGLDTSVLARWSLGNTTRMEQSLLDVFHEASAAQGPASTPASAAAGAASALPDDGAFPSLAGAIAWLNSPALTPQQLRGKVVLVDFWTYSCINCLRTLPYVRGWWRKYKNHGLVVIGVHTPEFAFERSLGNVKAAVRRLHIGYPVAVDSRYAIWSAFGNEYWPADYFIDATGRIRGHAFGEGDYRRSEHWIRELLRSAGHENLPGGYIADHGEGAEAAPDIADIESPETYIGYQKAVRFVSVRPVVPDRPVIYRVPQRLELNQWGLGGAWTIHGERAVLDRAPGRIVFRFHARDLHLVLAPPADGTPVRFRVLLDGAPPGDEHGADTDAAGFGVVRQDRLYQVIRQSGAIRDRTFTIEFLDPGVAAYSFTFG